MSNPLISPWLKPQFCDQNGVPLSGGFLYAYTAGTSTPQATYTDETGATPNTNPVVLDSAGRCSLWLGSGSYKFVLTDSLGNPIWTVDQVSAQGNGNALGTPNTFTIADNQSALANITGLIVDHTVNQCMTVEYTIIRTDGTNWRREHGYLFLTYDSENGWNLTRRIDGGVDALNLNNGLYINSSGQVRYQSDSMGGTYQGKMTWQISSAFAAEGI